MSDKDKNRNIDGPIFNINNGAIDFSIYKMDTGFLVINNQDKAKHSISKLEDLEAIFEIIHEGVKEKIRNLMNNKTTFDYIDVGVQITEGFDQGDAYQYEDVQPESMELSYDQLADVINEMISGSPTGGMGPRMGHRSPIYISAAQVQQAMNSPRNMIKLRQRPSDRVKNPDRDKNVRSDPSGDNKNLGKIKFGDKTKNRDIDRKEDNSEASPTVIS